MGTSLNSNEEWVEYNGCKNKGKISELLCKHTIDCNKDIKGNKDYLYDLNILYVTNKGVEAINSKTNTNKSEWVS